MKERVSRAGLRNCGQRSLIGGVVVLALLVLTMGVGAPLQVRGASSGPTIDLAPKTKRHSPRHHKPVIVLDPGHGGWDTGAVHVTPKGHVDLMEKTVNLEVALYAAAMLRHAGYPVFLTRTRDTSVRKVRAGQQLTEQDRIAELEARVRFSNDHHARVFVSIHFNGSLDERADGMTVYYCPAHRFWRSNLRLAQLLDGAIHSRLKKAGYAPPNEGVQTDVSDKVPQAYADYPWFLQIGPASKRHHLIENKAVSALGEAMFITNNHEDRLLHQKRILKTIAAGYAQGIEAFLRGQK